MAPGTVQGIVLTSPGLPAYEQHVRIRVYQGPAQLEQSPSEIAGTVGMPVPDPLSIRVLDANGVPLPRVLVHFGSNGTLAYLGETLTAAYFACSLSCQNGEPRVFSYTDASGSAAVHLTLPTATTAGTFVLPEMPRQLETSDYVARVPGMGWSITVAPGPTARIVIETGNNQAGSTGGTLALPLVVRVVDQYGNARVDETVTWTVASGAGSVASPTTTTDGLGLSDNTWTLGPTAGTQTLSATAGPATVMFSAIASGP